MLVIWGKNERYIRNYRLVRPDRHLFGRRGRQRGLVDRHPVILMVGRAIDVERVLKLFDALGSWRKVGIALANEEWRPMPYQASSIRAAIRRRNMCDFTGIKELPRVRCHFDVVLPCPAPGVVAIVDQDDGVMSVTNNIENVVKRLATLGMLREGDRLIYRDSGGMWDEAVWTPERGFIEFNLLRAPYVKDAVRKMFE